MDALSTYRMSLFSIPRSTEKIINQMRRCFLLQGNKGNTGYNLLRHGSLGIKKINLHNNCLLHKWLLKFIIEDIPLWKRLITEKYGLLNQWKMEDVEGTFGCSLSKTVQRLWPKFSTKISYKMRNGKKI